MLLHKQIIFITGGIGLSMSLDNACALVVAWGLNAVCARNKISVVVIVFHFCSVYVNNIWYNTDDTHLYMCTV